MDSCTSACYQGVSENSCDSLNLYPVNQASLPPMYFRPRGSMAKALVAKQENDEYLSQMDKMQWYQCDTSSMSKDFAKKFVQLAPDDDTNAFLEGCEEKSDWLFTHIYHAIVKFFLGWFMTQTSINGLLQRGQMFVLSSDQLKKLVKSEQTSWQKESLLDLGAGDGEVTAKIAPLFKNVFVTEVSNPMRTLLKQKGYKLLEIDNWYYDRKYDVISCLNLLDRCDTPLQLLQQIKEALNPDGLLLLGIVLPFSAYVESGSKSNKPKEFLPIIGQTFEEQVESLINDVIIPSGFEVISWSRVPYLCEGDLNQMYYWLDDAVLILSPKNSL